MLEFNKWHFVELIFGNVARFDTYLDVCFLSLIVSCKVADPASANKYGGYDKPGYGDKTGYPDKTSTYEIGTKETT